MSLAVLSIPTDIWRNVFPLPPSLDTGPCAFSLWSSRTFDETFIRDLALSRMVSLQNLSSTCKDIRARLLPILFDGLGIWTSVADVQWTRPPYVLHAELLDRLKAWHSSTLPLLGGYTVHSISLHIALNHVADNCQWYAQGGNTWILQSREREITSAFFLTADSLNGLRSIELDGTWLDPSHFAFLAALKHISHLKLARCNISIENSMAVQWLDMGHFIDLEVLQCRGASATFFGLVIHFHLESLILDGHDYGVLVANVVRKRFGLLSNLRRLDVRGDVCSSLERFALLCPSARSLSVADLRFFANVFPLPPHAYQNVTHYTGPLPAAGLILAECPLVQLNIQHPWSHSSGTTFDAEYISEWIIRSQSKFGALEHVQMAVQIISEDLIRSVFTCAVSLESLSLFEVGCATFHTDRKIQSISALADTFESLVCPENLETLELQFDSFKLIGALFHTRRILRYLRRSSQPRRVSISSAKEVAPQGLAPNSRRPTRIIESQIVYDAAQHSVVAASERYPFTIMAPWNSDLRVQSDRKRSDGDRTPRYVAYHEWGDGAETPFIRPRDSIEGIKLDDATMKELLREAQA